MCALPSRCARSGARQDRRARLSKTSRLSACTILAIAALPDRSRAGPAMVYNLGVIGGMGAGSIASQGRAINDAGLVAGVSYSSGGVQRAFRYEWRDGANLSEGGFMRDLGDG